MDKVWKQARKESGLARFERESTRLTHEEGRLKRAYRVPGTREAGQYHMLWVRACDIANQLRKQPH